MSEDPSTLPARTSVAQSSRVQWLIPVGVIFGLLIPLLFSDRTFSTDWGNHLWLIWAQGANLGQLGEPSYFLQSSLGVFYPYYAFYGGSFYAVAGFVSWLFGAEAAALAAYAGALAATYLGWTWIARQLGIAGWQSQLPGCIAVTAPLAVTNLYGRGDIPEVVATGMIPLVAAAGLSIFRERRVRLSSAAVYVIGIVFLTGTHTLSLVWAAFFLAVVTALLVACYWHEAQPRPRLVPVTGDKQRGDHGEEEGRPDEGEGMGTGEKDDADDVCGGGGEADASLPEDAEAGGGDQGDHPGGHDFGDVAAAVEIRDRERRGDGDATRQLRLPAGDAQLAGDPGPA